MKEANFTCTNCGAMSSGAYCSSCGQRKFQREHFALKQSLRDIFSEFSNIESSLGKTLRTLILKPGKLTADYLTGKQKSYVTPIKLYLVIITINFLVYSALEDYSLVNIGFLKKMADDVAWFQQTIQEAQFKSGLTSDAFLHQVNTRVNDTLPVLLYFLIFAQALVLKVQFRSQHRYYIEHLIFALHFMSFGLLRDVALLPIQFFNKQAGFAISILTTVWYLFQSLKRAYQLNGKRLFVQTLLHYIIFFLLFTLTITVAVMLSLIS